MTRSFNVAGIVLAAGASRRMGSGTNKLLLDVGGEPMIRRVVGRAVAAGLARVIVVVGHEASRVRGALGGVECTFVESPDFTGPTSVSLHAGLRAIGAAEARDIRHAHDTLDAHALKPDSPDAAVVMLGDMVHVTTAMIGSLVDSAREGDAPLAVSRYGDVFAPPLLFRRVLWPELLAWNGEGCGKAVVMAHQAEAVILDWPAGALMDVDTVEDYRSVAGTEVGN